MEVVAFWVTLSIFVGILANNRGRSGFWWFAISLLISPLVAAIFVGLMSNLANKAATPPAAPQANTRKTKRCPLCAEDIMREATRCKHCGADIPAEPDPIPETDEEAIVRFGIRRESGQYLYGKYRYNELSEALAEAKNEHGES